MDMEISLNATDAMNGSGSSQEANETMQKSFNVTTPDGLKDSEILLNGYDI